MNEKTLMTFEVVKRRLSSSFLALALGSVFMSGSSLFSQAQVQPPLPLKARNLIQDEVLVRLRPQIGLKTFRSRSVDIGKTLNSIDKLRVMRVKLPAGSDMQAALKRLKAMPEVEYAEQNHMMKVASVPNDSFYVSNQYGPRITSAEQAWDIWSPHGQVTIAIIDTGVDSAHPDLTNKILRDGSGVVGYDSAVVDPQTGQLGARAVALDDYGHGTHVAGIAGAQSNNSLGVAGIAGWDGNATHTDVSVKIMPVKVLTNGSGSDADVAGGIIWATDHGAKVLNMSLGDTASTNTLDLACQYAWNHGCVVVAAAGNDGSSGAFYPASFDHVISVAASDSTDTLASFSNYGSRVNVTAPGVSIASTFPTYANHFVQNYGVISGTSMACPHVAGEAALIASHNPNLSNMLISYIIQKYVDPYTPYNSNAIMANGGRINILRALQQSTIPQFLDPPNGVTGTSGDRSATIDWNLNPLATSYNVRRSLTHNGPYATIATTSAHPYTDTGLVNGTTYYYVVTALSSSAESANSAEVAVTPRPSGNTASFVRVDAATRGNWIGNYGADGYNVFESAVSYPAYATVTPSGNQRYVWAASTPDPGGLQKLPNGADRIASTWYASPNATYTINVNMTDGIAHQVALYCFNYNGGSARQLKVDVLDSANGSLLDTQTIADYAGGKYLIWTLKGNLTLRLSSPNGDYSVASGLFFDTTVSRPPSAPTNLVATSGNAKVTLNWSGSSTASSYSVKRSLTSGGQYATISANQTGLTYVDNTAVNGTTYYYVVTASNSFGESVNSSEVSATPQSSGNTASFVRVDATTRGNWIGNYGADGYNVFESAVSYPAYATVTPSGNQRYVWAASTPDLGGLQKLPGGTDRIASTWYASPNATYTINVNMSDGAAHQVALYCFNFNGSPVRQLKVDILDGVSGALLDTQTISDYVGGKYLVWTLKGNLTLRLSSPSADYSVASGLFFDTTVSRPPSAPTNLVATSGNAKVTLSWNSSPSATGYSVKRSLTSGGPYANVATNQAGLTFADNTVTNGTTYRYVVTASNSFGESVNSAEVSATPQASGNTASFLRVDATTRGNWIGNYGADGYNVFESAVSYPAYATVTPSGNQRYVWAASTPDLGGLQKLPGGTDRIAATWYAAPGATYNLSVNLTDGIAHQVALYCFNYNGYSGRQLKVDVLDGVSGALLDTQTISDYAGGKYLVWTLKGNLTLRFSSPNADYSVVSGIFFR